MKNKITLDESNVEEIVTGLKDGQTAIFGSGADGNNIIAEHNESMRGDRLR